MKVSNQPPITHFLLIRTLAFKITDVVTQNHFDPIEIGDDAIEALIEASVDLILCGLHRSACTIDQRKQSYVPPQQLVDNGLLYFSF